MNPCVMSNTTPLAKVPWACTHHGSLSPHTRIPWACRSAIVRLFLRQMPVDESLRDVEYHAVGEGAVGLPPPRIFVTPHAYALGMPICNCAAVPSPDARR